MRKISRAIFICLVLLSLAFSNQIKAQGASYVTSNLILRLDASVAGSYSGTTWTDQSSSGYNATAYGSPVLDSSDGSISFNGTNQYFDLGTAPFAFSNTANFSFQVIFTPSVVPSTVVGLIARQNSGKAGNWIVGMDAQKGFFYNETAPWGHI